MAGPKFEILPIMDRWSPQDNFLQKMYSIRMEGSEDPRDSV